VNAITLRDARHRGRRRLLWSAFGLACGIVAAIATTTTSGASFTASTTDAPTWASGALSGANAPASGATFTAAPTAIQTCQLSWGALSGGTAVADRYQVDDISAGSTVTTTANVNAGSTSVGQTQVVRTYRLLTRAGTNWISSTADSRTAACSLTEVVSVDAGTNSSCAIKSDRTLWCWGLGETSTIGDGTLLTRTSPVQVGSATTWRQVSVGNTVACATRTDNTGWCWGDNGAGGVGDGTTTGRNAPVQVTGAWSQMATGADHACGIKTDATLWCWGDSGNGQAGVGFSGSITTPAQVGSSTWAEVTSSTFHTCGIQTDATLWCWGANWNGQIGNGTFTDQGTPSQVAGSWTYVSTGGSTTCAVKTDGTLWCWGSDWWLQGGSGVTQSVVTPTQVGSGTTWVRVASSFYATCATKTNGTLWCWGTDALASTGQNTATWTANATPTQVGAGTTWALVSGGALHFCALRTDGSLSCWGARGVGSTGQGNTSMLTYAQVGSGTNWSSASVGAEFSCGSKSDSTLWCWGNDDTAQLNYSGADGSAAPVQITLNGATTVTSFSAGYQSACAIRSSDSQLYCWGGNGSGQLGQGYSSWRETALRVGSPNTYSSVSMGYTHACAIRSSDSTLWCWGDNWAGQVGDGTTTNRTSPVQVSGGGAWTAVSVSPYHTCALKSGGTLWCWGANWNGQLGNGTVNNASSPTQVGALTYSAVNAGYLHTCAIRSGAMWCWGENSRGEVGDGTTVDRTSPVQVGAVTTWDAVSSGHLFTCAHRTDNTVWCWGTNNSGQFGNGAVSIANTSPVQVASSTSLIRASKMGYHSCIVKTAGTYWCAGGNTRSQLGVDDYTGTPTVVTGTWKT